MKQTLTTKNFIEIYPELTDSDKIAYVDAMYHVCTGKEYTGNLPTSLRKGQNLRIFHLRQTQEEFDRDLYLEEMLSCPKGYIRIIGLYLLATNVKMYTKDIAQSIINRHSRDAKLLEPWLETDEAKEELKLAIINTANHARSNDYQFTLQTVYKKLTSQN